MEADLTCFSVGRFQNRPCISFCSREARPAGPTGRAPPHAPGHNSPRRAQRVPPSHRWSVYSPSPSGHGVQSSCRCVFPCIFRLGRWGPRGPAETPLSGGEPRAGPRDGSGDAAAGVGSAGSKKPEEVIDVTEDDPPSGGAGRETGAGSGPAAKDAGRIPESVHFAPIINFVEDFEDGFVNWRHSSVKLTPADIRRWESRIDQVQFSSCLLPSVLGVPVF